MPNKIKIEITLNENHVLSQGLASILAEIGVDGLGNILLNAGYSDSEIIGTWRVEPEIKITQPTPHTAEPR